jgi:hypothetical protein
MSLILVLFLADCFGKIGELRNFWECRPRFLEFLFFFKRFGFLKGFPIFFVFCFLFLFLLVLFFLFHCGFLLGFFQLLHKVFHIHHQSRCGL